MTRYFSVLATIVMLAVSGTFLLGLGLGDLQQVYRDLRGARIQPGLPAAPATPESPATSTTLPPLPELMRAESWARAHRLAGLGSALLVVLLYSMAITYFIGTGRWCREVVQTYQLDVALQRRGDALKRRAFAWSLGAMFWGVVMVALGAAADPSTGRAGTEQWVTPHLAAGILGLGWLAWATAAVRALIEQQYSLIQLVLVQVRQKRLARGLAV